MINCKIVYFKKIFVLSFVILFLFSSNIIISANELKEDNISDVNTDIQYSSYIKNQKTNHLSDIITIEYDKVEDYSSQNIKNIDTRNALIIDEGNEVSFNVSIEKEGFYPISFTYHTINDSNKDIIASVKINNQIPFSEAGEIVLYRYWHDKDVKNGKFNTDSLGNDLLPKQEEIKTWIDLSLKSNSGLFNSPYMFYFQKGTQKISVKAIQEGMALQKIVIGNNQDILSYKDYEKKYKNQNKNKEIYLNQAEITKRKNKATLYPLSDRTTTATIPYDAYHTKLNTIGQSNWSTSGESISWTVNVREKGLYRILFRARQSFNEGMNSYRTLYVNGKIPFKEASAITFPYKTDWYSLEFSGDEPYYLYLEPNDEITLEVTSADMSEVLCSVKNSVLRLNELYRKIIVITGTTPDTYRDYSLDKKIDGLFDEVGAIKNSLKSSSKKIKKMIGDKGSQASAIDKSISILQSFEDKPYEMTAKLATFKDNIENLGSLVNTLGSQPLELDYFMFIPKGEKSPNINAKWYKDLKYNFSKFFISFINDYSSLGTDVSDKNVKKIDVWVSTGRDQAQVINSMITDSFTFKTSIGVDLSLVSTGNILIQATLAGKGPHVALSVGHEEPVNLAMRGALVDLSDKKYSLSEIKNDFFPSAFTPFEYNGGIYAMPETQNFDMFFYRTDIFDELNLTPPNTWKEFYVVLKTLQENNLLFGIQEINQANAGVSSGISTFDKFLFQNGGNYYNEKQDKTLFDTEVSYKAFENWVNLYARYGLDREFEFYNRFRSGEMPAGIQPYSMYNKIVEAAPEIRGLWKFTLIPGTEDENGNINRAESSTGTACILLNKAVKEKVDSKAFEFLKWWVSEEIQSRYFGELEAMMGAAARGTPANISAFRSLNWTKEEMNTIYKQWEYVKNPPQIPGNYTVSRSLTNAFRAALQDNQNARRYLQIYNKDINSEIKRKRKEFMLQ